MGPVSYKMTEKHNRKPLRNTILKDNNPTTVIPGERVKGKSQRYSETSKEQENMYLWIMREWRGSDERKHPGENI